MDPEGFKEILANFATGITVVTMEGEGRYHGITISSFTSVSLLPPLILVCIDQHARSHGWISETQRFAVSFLNEEQGFLADRFAGRAPAPQERFQDVEHHLLPDGLPVLSDSLGWLSCRVTEAVRAGDHTIFVAEVVDGGLGRPGHPLLLYGSRFRYLQT